MATKILGDFASVEAGGGRENWPGRGAGWGQTGDLREVGNHLSPWGFFGPRARWWERRRPSTYRAEESWDRVLA
jgi:hypothetical protein